MAASSFEPLARELECGVCLESLRDPKILDCSHTFCKLCIDSLVDTEDKKIKCPMCMGTTDIPSGGVGDLKANLLARSMVEAMSSMNPQMVEVAQEATEAPCSPSKIAVQKLEGVSNTEPRLDIKCLYKKLVSQRIRYEQTIGVISMREEDISAAAARARDGVNSTTESIVAEVRGKQQGLLEVIQYVCKMRRHFMTMQTASFKDVLQKIDVAPEDMEDIDTKDDETVSELRQKIKLALRLMDRNPLPSAQVTDELSFLKFIAEKTPAYNIHLGDVVEEEEWQLQLQFGKFGPEVGQFNCARGVAISPSGDIAIAEQRNNRTCIFNGEGKHVLTMSGKSAGNPERGDRDVAFYSDGRCLILGKTNNINVYDNKGSYLNSIMTPATNPWALTVDENNTVFVGDLAKKVIYVLINGLVVRQIKVAHAPLSLAVDNKGKILVSSAASKRVDVLDISTGETLVSIESKSVDPSNLVAPWGPCFGPDDSIFIPFYKADVFNKGTVHEFGADGRHLGCVARGLQTPRDVAFTRDGRLVVVDGTTIKLYQLM
ncbi:tripartite motif-containing protein 2-like [Asterias rubens]|uniref:tripartite motif-containing protein 2-like n=1 Tax=Asterias rubens TaxID=7604 RepID=UPI0014559560|nr:tripartite motif-containing protein 2-like [Asterias rubens]